MNSRDGRDTRGRPFAPGNGGRPPGSKNKDTVFAASLLEGDREALLRKGLELAKRGNVRLLVFFLSRLLPRDRLISFAEIVSASDARGALQSILGAVSTGVISPAEGASLAALIAPLIHEVAGKPSSRELTPSLIDHLQSPDKE
jgi:hypothetical protein